MKMIAEYLENAINRTVGIGPKLKADFEKQALACRNLASKRASKLGLRHRLDESGGSR
jgi:hypothetical protein